MVVKWSPLSPFHVMELVPTNIGDGISPIGVVYLVVNTIRSQGVPVPYFGMRRAPPIADDWISPGSVLFFCML